MVSVYFYNYDKFYNKEQLDPYKSYCFYTHDKERVKETKKMVNKLLMDKSNYIHTANVDTDSLDLAFMLTNNIDHSWCNNMKVDVEHYVGRSSMIGDIFVLDGRKFIVMSMGFEEVE